MKSLRQVLADCTDRQLEQIAHIWAVGNPPAKGWAYYPGRLEQGMRDLIAARFAWEHFAPDERLLIYNILGPSARNWAVRDELPKKVDLSAARYKAALESLKRRTLVLEVLVKIQGNQLVDHRMGFYSYGDMRKLPVQAADILYVPTEIATFLYTVGREFFLPQPERTKITFEKILTPLYQSELDELSRRYGIELDGSYYSRTDYRSMLAASLVQPEATLYALQQLDAQTHNLFSLLCERDGKLSVQAIREFTSFDDATLATMFHTLAQYAIAFDTFLDEAHVLFVPFDIYKNLKEAPTQSSAPTRLVSCAAPPVVRSGDTITLHDLATIIGTVYQQDIELTKSGTVPKRIAAKIEPLLRGKPRTEFMNQEENVYLETLFTIAQELGLIQLSRGVSLPPPSGRDIKQRYEPGPTLEQWSHMGAAEQTRRLLQLWISSTRWGDIVGANFRDWYAGYVDPKAVRGSLITYIRAGLAREWYTVASLVQLIRGQDPFVLRPRQRGIPSLGYRKASELRQHWDTCDKEIVIGSLSSSFFELGMVALGYQEADALEAEKYINPEAFTLTELGATVLSGEAQSSPSTPSSPLSNGHRSLVVQPSFELLLLQPDLLTLYSLLPFAQVNQVGVVSRLTLTRESVLRAIALGMPIEQILQLLEERSQKGVPQNVAYTLRDWAKLYKGATILQIVLLEVTSEAVANEICTSAKLQEFGLRRLGPCAIATSSDVNLQDLRRALDKLGIAVRISTETGATARVVPTNVKVITGGRRR